MDKQLFVETLSSTNRKGIENVLAKLEELGFYDAPASSKFHLSCKGGLLEHSMNVYEAATLIREQAIKVHPELEEQLPLDSVAICTLLHDTCKTDIYKEGILSRKNADGYWEKYVGFQVDYNTGLPLGHGEKSVIMLLSWGLELKPEEMLAIRWHMTAWDLPMQSPEHKESLNAAKAKTPLVSLVQLADGFATGLIERL
ncbi:MAG: HD domain-containing protein [Bacteroidales bacterium]|nr:HD domain-containing protein [Bacteroidales bacterium]